MKKHYIKHSLNNLQDLLHRRLIEKDRNTYFDVLAIIHEIRKELDKDDDKREV